MLVLAGAATQITQITSPSELHNRISECQGSHSLPPSLIGCGVVVLMSEAEELPWRWAPRWHFERTKQSIGGGWESGRSRTRGGVRITRGREWQINLGWNVYKQQVFPMLDVSDTKEYAVTTQLCISTQYQSSNDIQVHIMRYQISEVLISPAGSYIGLLYSNWALKTLHTTYLIHTFTQELFFCSWVYLFIYFKSCLAAFTIRIMIWIHLLC